MYGCMDVWMYGSSLFIKVECSPLPGSDVWMYGCMDRVYQFSFLTSPSPSPPPRRRSHRRGMGSAPRRSSRRNSRCTQAPCTPPLRCYMHWRVHPGPLPTIPCGVLSPAECMPWLLTPLPRGTLTRLRCGMLSPGESRGRAGRAQPARGSAGCGAGGDLQHLPRRTTISASTPS